VKSPRITPRITNRQLNRATLARQMLLAREQIPVLRAVERLVAMQAQLARPPFVGLWTRVQDFQREDLLKLIHRRQVVRATMMRCTLHLLSARDYLAMRAPMQPMLGSIMTSVLRTRANGLRLDELVGAATRFFGEEPRTFEELRDVLSKQFPKVDPRAIGYAVRTHLPLIQVPHEPATWGYPPAADFALAERWLGDPIEDDASPKALVLRYLAAFGPATAADAQAWSGLRGLGEVFESLRPKLKTFRDERDRELFDLPRAPRPDEDTPAPVRFLPDYDNLVLAHADRSRLIADEHRRIICTANLQILPTFLVDGIVAGTWSIARKRSVATLRVQPFKRLASRDADELIEEGRRLLRFVELDADKTEVELTRS
jgi:hypothetical protein